MFQVIFIVSWKKTYYKINLIENSSQIFCHNLKSASHKLIASQRKMQVFEYVYKICHKELAIFLKFWETFKWFLKLAILIKNAAFPQVISCHFLKTKFFLEHLPIAAPGIATKYAPSHQYKLYDRI